MVSLPNADLQADAIRETERLRLRALVNADLTVASPLHADDFQLITPFGIDLSKEQYLGAVAAGDINYLAWDIDSDVEVRVHGDSALIRYRSQIEIALPEGPLPRSPYWHTDTYEVRAGQWQVVWSQATSIAR